MTLRHPTRCMAEGVFAETKAYAVLGLPVMPGRSDTNE